MNAPSAAMSGQSKPPYVIPSMAAINALPSTGVTVADLFSGCGGTCLGWRMTGAKILYACEFVPIAQDSYRANMSSSTFLDTRDVKQVTGEDLLAKIDMQPGQLDVLTASPPCQSFASCGPRDKNWGKGKTYEHGVTQCNEDLFYEFIRILAVVQPKVFVAENVLGLVKGKAKGYFLTILAKLKASGYRVAVQAIDAQWLGVPQARPRTIFIGVRNDLARDPVFPKPFVYQYTVNDVLPWIVREKHSGFPNNWQPSNKPASTIVASGGRLTETAYLSGGAWIEALTDHGIVRRRFTIDELKVLCSFPADFILKGTFEQQWERLGNSVLPLFAKAIAEPLCQRVLGITMPDVNPERII